MPLAPCLPCPLLPLPLAPPASFPMLPLLPLPLPSCPPFPLNLAPLVPCSCCPLFPFPSLAPLNEPPGKIVTTWYFYTWFFGSPPLPSKGVRGDGEWGVRGQDGARWVRGARGKESKVEQGESRGWGEVGVREQGLFCTRFLGPHHLWAQKVQLPHIVVGYPHHLEIETVPHVHLQNGKSHSQVPTKGPKFWSKKTKPATKVTLASHQNANWPRLQAHTPQKKNLSENQGFLNKGVTLTPFSVKAHQRWHRLQQGLLCLEFDALKDCQTSKYPFCDLLWRVNGQLVSTNWLQNQSISVA